MGSTCYGLAAVALIYSLYASCAPTDVHLSGSAGPTAEKATGLQAELDGLVAVIPAGGPHNEMALRSSRHWRKVSTIARPFLSVPSYDSTHHTAELLQGTRACSITTPTCSADQSLPLTAGYQSCVCGRAAISARKGTGW